MTILYQKAADLRLHDPEFVAIDTETTLFTPAKYGWKNKTRVAPFGYPDLVIGSFAMANERGGQLFVWDRAASISYIRTLLLSKIHLVFHNHVFDIKVFEKADPSLIPLFAQAVEDNRVHDTKLMEVLLQIARGSRTVSNRALVMYPTLKYLAKKRAGMELDKDDSVRCNFGQYIDAPSDIPENFLSYAARDAEATYRVYESQLLESRIYSSDDYCRSPVLPGAEKVFGPLTEAVQVKAALAFAWLEQFPVTVDLAHASALRDRLEGEKKRFEAALLSYDWAKVGPKSHKWKLRLGKVRLALEAFEKAKGIVVPRTPTGLISVKHDDWAPHIEKIDPEVYKAPTSIPPENIDARLQVWLRFMRVSKLLATYVYPYASSEVHYPQYKVIGARTTRTSCETPNIQNVPKRKDGIRALFVPRPGHVLIERDFKAAELVGLAETYHLLYGGSVLGETINSGLDPHVAQARRIIPGFDALPEGDQKRNRQAAKAVNFGLPGGLGAATLVRYARSGFGVSLSLEDAQLLRAAALGADPQLAAYLAERNEGRAAAERIAKNVGCTWQDVVTALAAWKEPWDPHEINDSILFSRIRAWKHGNFSPALSLPPGFDPRFDLFKSHARSPAGTVRGNCTYTQAHNLPFQSLVAVGAKLALWNLYRASINQPGLFRPVAFIHDSILIEAEERFWSQADTVLDQAMVAGLKACCPHIKVETESTGPLTRWGKDTNPWGEEVKCTVEAPCQPSRAPSSGSSGLEDAPPQRPPSPPPEAPLSGPLATSESPPHRPL